MIINQIFNIKKLDGGSTRYGACEYCHKPVDVVYLLLVKNIAEIKGKEHILEGAIHFGHRNCMTKITNAGRVQSC
ncbi:hypothetical protein [Vibrio alfacsensis]|uniref:hypothetical protein n=2 Tax=Vibrio TaxID=662 RepID=UPI00078BDA38|nr:hypothetical protein [Vibrio alfacsensis]BAU70818.1 hypothetical protein [Vibrio sp. 04Ya108]BBM67613.1 hypothetical protein VA249_42590 [Vibrio alfacsensis]BCN27096.1 hypothetical protein VYA_42880 [Vibrio alfacsensis]